MTMRTVRRILVTIAVTAAIGYSAAVGYLMTQETRLVFAAGRPLAQSRPVALQQVELPRTDGARQFGWIMRQAADADKASWVLFLHGNAATIASRVNIVRYEHLRSLGLNVLAPEYRGFAGLPGTPTESSVTEDAQGGYRYLRETLHVPPSRIIIYGWSLGSAIAVNVASSVGTAALILEGAPASLVAIGERDYPWMPIRLVMRNPFESVRKIDRITVPKLFIHSPEDTVIPIAEGRALFEAAPGPKRFVEVRGGHIDPADVDAATMLEAIRTFLLEAALLAF